MTNKSDFFSLELEEGLGGDTMTIEECYQELDGDYADVSTRLPSRNLIDKFVKRFLEDKCFDTLCREMEAGNRAEAFRAAHTLKGVCANLSFSRLLSSAGRLTEELRPETDTIPDSAADILEEVRNDYQATVTAICQYAGIEK